MEGNEGISLPQLTGDIVKNARKTRLDAFAVAIEGWRRGLKLTWYTKDSEHFDDMIIFGVNPPGRLFSLSSDEKTHYFFRTRGDLVSNEAVEVGSEKDETKEILLEKGVPVPLGKGFPPEATDEEIIEYSKTIDYPIVFKPTNASQGDGVVTNIQDDEGFLKALKYVRHDLGYKEVIVEQHVEGEEYRVYVVDDKVVAIYNRKPANIIGDGKHDIEELIGLKNRERRKNARLNSCLIEMDIEILEFIQEAGYALTSIPEKGERIYLRQKTNVSTGGDPLDATDDLSDEIKQIAVDALKALPGFIHGGVDIIVNENRAQNVPAVVIELNPTAQIGGALFPLRGTARDVPGAIIDYYFPETAHIDTSESKVYFDFINVLEPLENRSALEVEVSPAPMGKLHIKRFVVTGQVQRHNYHRWLKQSALDRNLHGYVKNTVFNEIEIVIAGTDPAVINDFKEQISNYPQASKVNNITEEKWDEPVTVGFEITEKYNTRSVKSVQHALRRMNKDLLHLRKQRDRVVKDNKHILNSSSWKFTSPLRTLGEKVKNRKSQ
ncbi:acylphosphatase [Salinicoccus sp. YB14-2]|uniref:acylphosphatase n=1 Tax=Salinicoccus sp. YB14-2 TaxID=1572701 RepID=UPI000689D784|nr:acylphosphatase [Salinicoccus sp. YB14-2]